MFSNRTDLYPLLKSAGRATGERVWGFPMDEDFDESIESKVADVAQCASDSDADHILAARFLGGSWTLNTLDPHGPVRR